jgi:hypothetical protein
MIVSQRARDAQSGVYTMIVRGKAGATESA